jgi:hypothetical protein
MDDKRRAEEALRPREVEGSYQAMRQMTQGEVLAMRCVAPLREFSDAGGWVTPQAIGPLQSMIAGYLDGLRR